MNHSDARFDRRHARSSRKHGRTARSFRDRIECCWSPSGSLPMVTIRSHRCTHGAPLIDVESVNPIIILRSLSRIETLRTGVVHIVPCKMVSLVIVGNVCVEMLHLCSICRHRGREKAGTPGIRFSGTRRRRSPCSTVAIRTGAGARGKVTGARFGRRPTLARVQLAESVGLGKVRCVGYGRKALALSVHPSGLGFIGRQIKPGRSPQRRQRQRRDGGDSRAPPQFLLRHGSAPWTCAVRNCPTGWIIAQVPIFHCALKLSNCCCAVTILPRPRPACSAGTFTTASRAKARIASQGGSHDPDRLRSCSPP
jgi:hypothetical protein